MSDEELVRAALNPGKYFADKDAAEALDRILQERDRYRGALQHFADGTYSATFSHVDENGVAHYGIPEDGPRFAQRILAGEQVS